jgi:hypothetical protein
MKSIVRCEKSPSGRMPVPPDNAGQAPEPEAIRTCLARPDAMAPLVPVGNCKAPQPASNAATAQQLSAERLKPESLMVGVPPEACGSVGSPRRGAIPAE